MNIDVIENDVICISNLLEEKLYLLLLLLFVILLFAVRFNLYSLYVCTIVYHTSVLFPVTYLRKSLGVQQ